MSTASSFLFSSSDREENFDEEYDDEEYQNLIRKIIERGGDLENVASYDSDDED